MFKRFIIWLTKKRYIGEPPVKSPGFYKPMDIAPGEQGILTREDKEI